MSLLLLLPVLAGTVALVVTGLVRRSPPSRESAVAAARAHARLGSLAAVVLGGAAALWTGTARLEDAVGPGGLGVTALLVPIAFGVVHTAVLAVTELTWPRPEGAVRRARLARRGSLDAAPRWLVRTAGVAAAAAVLTLVAGAALAGPDGRSVAVSAGEGRVLATHSPFAGPVYGAPAAVGLLALAALTVGALWVVANRPAVVTADDRVEAALRRASAHRVLRGAVAAALVVSGGLLAVSGLALRSAAMGAAANAVGNGLPAGAAAAALPWVGGALGLAGALAVLVAAVVLCTRAPRVPAGEPVVPA
ncbi:hypothetical protein [Geodermatophilus sp. DSM 45219]|uniref:hypothetical protein n=1 Tax=Geodermatophilus sp. DSM 45219 TaxID=1881103 RepID=UPI00088E706E|nr:hypothetical protein [Geodermatophilus sp. DSM 45219]SDO01220.1 hypothetical protein SAMN05428965_2398 [Geodermatophilus sp. DSM 45219]